MSPIQNTFCIPDPPVVCLIHAHTVRSAAPAMLEYTLFPHNMQSVFASSKRYAPIPVGVDSLEFQTGMEVSEFVHVCEPSDEVNATTKHSIPKLG